MPRKLYEKLPVPRKEPDACCECPLLGWVPAGELKHGDRYNRICLFSKQRISGRGSKVRKSAHTSKHPVKRQCSQMWSRWNGCFKLFYKTADKYKVLPPSRWQTEIEW